MNWITNIFKKVDKEDKTLTNLRKTYKRGHSAYFKPTKEYVTLGYIYDYDKDDGCYIIQTIDNNGAVINVDVNDIDLKHKPNKIGY